MDRISASHTDSLEAGDHYVDWCEDNDLDPDTAEAERAYESRWDDIDFGGDW